MTPDVAAVLVAATAGVVIAYIESRSQHPSSQIHERVAEMSERMAGMRELMARMEERYNLYPSADWVNDQFRDADRRLAELERLREPVGEAKCDPK
jgi:hypothetical protein